MTDALLRWDDELAGARLSVLGDDLATTDSLDTALLISLFTDRRAPDDAVLDDTDDRGGYWADTWPDVDGDATGSLLWLLRREKQSAENLLKAQSYAREALAWLQQDSVASKVAITASYPIGGWLQLDVAITLPTGETRRWNFTLGAQSEVQAGVPGEVRGTPGTPAVSADTWSAPASSRPGERRGTDGSPEVVAETWSPRPAPVPGERLGVGGTPVVVADAWTPPPADVPGELQGAPGTPEISVGSWQPPPPSLLGQIGCGESSASSVVTCDLTGVRADTTLQTCDQT